MVVEIERQTAVAAARLWDVLTDWPRHGRYVPCTRLEVTSAPGPGQQVDAITQLGPIDLVHDVMVVQEWSPPLGDAPGVVQLTKIGRVLGGSARIEVHTRSGGSRVTWREEVWPRPAWLGAVLAPAFDLAARPLFGRTLDGLIREAVA